MNEIDFKKSRLVEALARFSLSGIYCLGAQAFVSRGDEVLIDVGIGYGLNPALMKSGDIHEIYCNLKPICTQGIGLLVDKGLVDLNIPAGEHFNSEHPFRRISVSVGDILCHNAGLGGLKSYVAVLSNEQELEAQLIQAAEQAHISPAFSEYSGWSILGSLIEEKTGMKSRDFMKKECFEPLGIADEIILSGMEMEELEKIQERIGPQYQELPLKQRPALTSRAWWPTACFSRFGFGGYASMHAVGTMLQSLLKVLKGNQVAGLPSTETFKKLMDCHRGAQKETTSDFQMDFAGGFMVELDLVGFTDRLSKSSFGHSALAGTISMFVDPEKDLCASIYMNGFGSGPEDIKNIVGVVTNAIVDDYENLDTPVVADSISLSVLGSN